MAKPKIAYDGEWVKTSLQSRRFNTDGSCDMCRYLTAGTIWYSIKTRKTRCLNCFTPEQYVPCLSSGGTDS